jgi:site-specific recombinase XerC
MSACGTRLRYCRDDPGRSDVDLEAREVVVRGKGGRDRVVRIKIYAAQRADLAEGLDQPRRLDARPPAAYFIHIPSVADSR